MEHEYSYMTPTTPLAKGENVRFSFHPSPTVYLRDHKWMAAAAMVAGMWIIWALGFPYIWAGAAGGLAVVAVRAFYRLSDALGARWDLTESRLLGPKGCVVKLDEIKRLRTFGSAIQVVAMNGDKHLIKYQADRPAKIATLEAAIKKAAG